MSLPNESKQPTYLLPIDEWMAELAQMPGDEAELSADADLWEKMTGVGAPAPTAAESNPRPPSGDSRPPSPAEAVDALPDAPPEAPITQRQLKNMSLLAGTRQKLSREERLKRGWPAKGPVPRAARLTTAAAAAGIRQLERTEAQLLEVEKWAGPMFRGDSKVFRGVWMARKKVGEAKEAILMEWKMAEEERGRIFRGRK